MSQRAIRLDSFDDEHAARMTKMVMRLFEHWKLTYEEQAQMLGLSTKTHSTISRYKKGVSPIRFDRDSYDRVRFILAIHQLLRSFFPSNKAVSYAWIKTPNKNFELKTPLEVVESEGFLGLARVHQYLENYKAL